MLWWQAALTSGFFALLMHLLERHSRRIGLLEDQVTGLQERINKAEKDLWELQRVERRREVQATSAREMAAYRAITERSLASATDSPKTP